MIIFHKYEIRLMPGKTALELYAPNWEKAEQSKNYQDLLSVHHPRRLQVVDSPTQVSQSGTDSGRHPSKKSSGILRTAHICAMIIWKYLPPFTPTDISGTRAY